MVRHFGLLGHGVVGSFFARLLRARGADVVSYDVLLDRAGTAEQMRLKIAADGARPGTLELIETLLSARRADLLDEVWEEIRETLAPDRVERTLETWIRSHARSSGRRHCEMLEVCRFLEELNVQPVLTRAAAELFRRSNELGIAAGFEHEPERFTDVIDFLDSRLG